MEENETTQEQPATPAEQPSTAQGDGDSGAGEKAAEPAKE